VIYCYPMTGRPGRAIPDGWVQIPGAAGCTPQSTTFLIKPRLCHPNKSPILPAGGVMAALRVPGQAISSPTLNDPT
jgi:hypothetical protein